VRKPGSTCVINLSNSYYKKSLGEGEGGKHQCLKGTN